MRKAVIAGFVCVVVLGAQGCTLVRLVRFGRGEKELTIDANDIVFCGTKDGMLLFEAGLRFRNRSGGEARLRAVRVEARIDDRYVFHATSEQSVLIEPRQEVLVRVPVTVDLLSAAGALGGTRMLVLSGEAIADLGMFGEKRFSFRSENKLFSPDDPKLTFVGLSLRKSNLLELRLTLTLRRESSGERTLKSLRLSGSLYVNGLRAAAIHHEQTTQAAELLEVDVIVPTLAAVQTVAALVRGEPVDLRVDLLLEAETRALKYRIPYTFERKQVSFGGGSSDTDGDAVK